MSYFLFRSAVMIIPALVAWPVLAGDYGLSEAKGNLPDGVSIPVLIGRVLKSVLGFTGTIFFILVVFAGLMWMTAAGSEDRIKKAKQILVAAVIGLIIVLSAYAITKFVGETLS